MNDILIFALCIFGLINTMGAVAVCMLTAAVGYMFVIGLVIIGICGFITFGILRLIKSYKTKVGIQS